MSAEAVVADLFAAFERGDVDAMVRLFADDAVYHNVPMDPAVGVDAIRELLTQFTGLMEGVRIEVHRQLSDGAFVMQERTDSFSTGGTRVSFPICGVFEIEDGRIKRWSEYFDMTQAMGQ
ncbi:MAG: SgcJ/EcaC family oxidoreductase [Acidimicrobiia bacterium]